MKDWKQKLAKFIDESAMVYGGVLSTNVARNFIMQHGDDVLEEEQDELLYRRVLSAVREYLSSNTKKQETQLFFPGFGLPRFIAVVKYGEETRYVNSRVATWEDVKAGAAERQANIAAAVASADAYNETMERLRPYMEDYPERTVQEALALMESAVA